MKLFFLLMILNFSSSIYADVDSSTGWGSEVACYRNSELKGSNSAVLCKGVRSKKEETMVMDCYNRALKETTNYRAAVLCAGVKNEMDTRSVLKCFEDSPANGDRSAVLCSGVKSLSEAANNIKCFNESDADGNGASVLCSKFATGIHLFFMDLLFTSKKENDELSEKNKSLQTELDRAKEEITRLTAKRKK